MHHLWQQMKSRQIQNRLIFIIAYWLPPFCWALLIFDLSSHSFTDFTLPFNHLDKLIHAGIYGTLCFLLYRAFLRMQGDWWREKAVILSFLFSTLYGISDEIHQIFVPMRTPDLMDLLADGVGAGLFLIGVWSVRFFQFRKENNISFF
jgi:VanZ family protein